MKSCLSVGLFYNCQPVRIGLWWISGCDFVGGDSPVPPQHVTAIQLSDVRVGRVRGILFGQRLQNYSCFIAGMAHSYGVIVLN